MGKVEMVMWNFKRCLPSYPQNDIAMENGAFSLSFPSFKTSIYIQKISHQAMFDYQRVSEFKRGFGMFHIFEVHVFSFEASIEFNLSIVVLKMTGCFCSHFRSLGSVAPVEPESFESFRDPRHFGNGPSRMSRMHWTNFWKRLGLTLGVAVAMIFNWDAEVWYIILNTWFCYFFRHWSVDLTSWVSRFAQRQLKATDPSTVPKPKNLF